jgi:hypothetical protein
MDGYSLRNRPATTALPRLSNLLTATSCCNRVSNANRPVFVYLMRMFVDVLSLIRYLILSGYPSRIHRLSFVLSGRRFLDL